MFTIERLEFDVDLDSKQSVLFADREQNIGELDCLPGSLLLGLGLGYHVFGVWCTRGLCGFNNLQRWGQREPFRRYAREGRFLIKSLLKMLMTEVGKHIRVANFKHVDTRVSLRRF